MFLKIKSKKQKQLELKKVMHSRNGCNSWKEELERLLRGRGSEMLCKKKKKKAQKRRGRWKETESSGNTRMKMKESEEKKKDGETEGEVEG